jgi:hypothetical protein
MYGEQSPTGPITAWLRLYFLWHIATRRFSNTYGSVIFEYDWACDVGTNLSHMYNIVLIYTNLDGPGSVVGTATAYGMDGPGIESRWEARFSAPVQTCTEAHPASCTMGTESFPGVRCGRGVTPNPHPLLVPWSKIELYFYSPYWPSWPMKGWNLPYTNLMLMLSCVSVLWRMSFYDGSAGIYKTITLGVMCGLSLRVSFPNDIFYLNYTTRHDTTRPLCSYPFCPPIEIIKNYTDTDNTQFGEFVNSTNSASRWLPIIILDYFISYRASSEFHFARHFFVKRKDEEIEI